MSRRLLCAGFFVLAAACASGCGTGGLQKVTICGDVSVPADIDLVRIVLRDDMYAEKSSGAVDLVASSLSLPIEVEVTAYPGRGYLSVQALSSGLEVIRFDRLYATLDRIDPVRAALTQACLGVTSCALGQTCVDGACVIAPDGDTAISCTGTTPIIPDGGV